MLNIGQADNRSTPTHGNLSKYKFGLAEYITVVQ